MRVPRAAYVAAFAVLLAVAAAASWRFEATETRTGPAGVDLDGDGLPDDGSIQVTAVPLRPWAIPLALASLAVAALASFVALRERQTKAAEKRETEKRREGD